MKYLIYHANCADGAMSAYLACISSEFDKVVAGEHGTPLGIAPIPGDTVVFVDYSLPRDELFALRDIGCSLHIYDHHKTLAERLNLAPAEAFDGVVERIHVLYRPDRSGAGIMLDVALAAGCNVPPDVQQIALHIEDRDLWNWKLEGTKEILAALDAQLPRTYEAYCRDIPAFAAQGLDQLLVGGKLLLDAQQKRLDRIVEASRLLHSPYGKVAVVYQLTDISEAGDALLNRDPEADFAAIIAVQCSDVRISLRSRKGGTDVSAIAAAYGGGGHAAAAGFRATEVPGWLRGPKA